RQRLLVPSPPPPSADVSAAVSVSAAETAVRSFRNPLRTRLRPYRPANPCPLLCRLLPRERFQTLPKLGERVAIARRRRVRGNIEDAGGFFECQLAPHAKHHDFPLLIGKFCQR